MTVRSIYRAGFPAAEEFFAVLQRRQPGLFWCQMKFAGRLNFWSAVAALFFLPATLRAFVFYQLPGGGYLKWNTASPLLSSTAVNPSTKAVRYYIASDAYSQANREAEINAIRAAFDQWQNIPGSLLRFEFAGLIHPDGLDTRADGTNVVFWTKKNLRVNGGTENLSGRRGWTLVSFADDGSILDADIVLNGVEYSWFTDFNDRINQAQFVEGIVLHEIGHFVGLDHSPAGGATVRDAANGINTDAGLSSDEISAMRFLYGRLNFASIQGTVRMNGAGILGASVIAEDSAGNIAGATVTQSSGKYAINGLPGGTYRVRVCPLDPASAGNNNSLMRGGEVAVDYEQAVTGFFPTGNIEMTVSQGQTKVQDFNVTPGNPVRIISLSKPSTLESLITATRFAFSITQGESNLFVGVASPNFVQGASLSITGDGLAVGPTSFVPNALLPGVHVLRVPISVSSNATPGLRSFVVSQNGTVAYANGYLEIASAVPDYNFDGLDDRFQRQYWPLFTSAEAAPTADPDRDGFSNRFEFRTQTNPIDANSWRLAFSGILKNGSDAQLNWLSEPGAKYRLYERAAFGSASWQALGDLMTATGDSTTFSLPLSQAARFLRLELVR